MVIFTGGTPASLEPLWGTYCWVGVEGLFKAAGALGSGGGGRDDLFIRPKVSNLDIYFFFIFFRNVFITKSPLSSLMMVISPDFHIPFVAFDNLIT